MISSNSNNSTTSEDLPSGLYIVSTPLGNLKDLTLRALETLKQVDVILCEDTRVSRKLLSHYGISTPLRALHDYNESKMIPYVVDQLKNQKRLALISDAGTPLISDPGYKIIQAVREHHFQMTALPGPAALINALVLSGLPNHRFFFGGFLPSKSSERCKELQELALIPSTLIFYEAPQRLLEAIQDMRKFFEHRSLVITREMTKKFEEVIQGTWQEIMDRLITIPPRGEIVILVGPPSSASQQGTEEKLTELLEQSMKHQSLKAAVEEVSSLSGISRKVVYQKALMIRDSLS